MGETRDYLDAMRRAEGAPDDISRRIKEDVLRINGYLDDPGISDHDKDLQYVMDHDMEDPDEELRQLHEEYGRLNGSMGRPYDDWHESCGYMSVEDELRALEAAMSDEAVAARKAEYEAYLALKGEALAKGLVRHEYTQERDRARCGS